MPLWKHNQPYTLFYLTYAATEAFASFYVG